MYPESYIQKSSGALPALLSWIARHCCRMSRQRCGPGDLVLIFYDFISFAQLEATFGMMKFFGSMNVLTLLKSVTR